MKHIADAHPHLGGGGFAVRKKGGGGNNKIFYRTTTTIYSRILQPVVVQIRCRAAGVAAVTIPTSQYPGGEGKGVPWVIVLRTPRLSWWAHLNLDLALF